MPDKPDLMDANDPRWAEFHPLFGPHEFACKCGCGQVQMDYNHLKKLHRARLSSGCKYTISSGFRCRKHDRFVHRKKKNYQDTSSHPKGLATDIATPDSRTRYHVMRGLYLQGFARVGEGNGFAHCDSDEAKDQEVSWNYYPKKKKGA